MHEGVFFIHFRSAKIFYLLTNSRTSAKGTWASRGRMTLPTHWGEGTLFYTEGWSKERRNEGLLPSRSVLDVKKTRQHWGRVSSHAFIAIETVTLVWACTAITYAAMPLAAEA